MTIKLGGALSKIAEIGLLGGILAVGAAAGDRSYRFDISNQTLAQALRIYGQVSGQEIIFTEDLVAGAKPMSLQGEYTAEAALQRLLQGTGLVARRSPSGALMIQRAPPPESSQNKDPAPIGATRTSAAADVTAQNTGSGVSAAAKSNDGNKSQYTAGQLDEVMVVTTRRQRESATDVPQSITAFDEMTLKNLDIQNVNDYFTKVPNLGFSYGVSNLGFVIGRSISIRGISGGGTTGFYIDDTPIPDSIDPEVVDIQRIEVLKGPQGTLFGEGSLGGNVRLITNKPSFQGAKTSIELDGGWTAGGASPDYRVSDMTNFVMVPGKVAVRAVAFVNHNAGFTTRAFPNVDGTLTRVDNQGAQLSYGGSVSVLYQATDSFSATSRIMAQNTRNQGWPVEYAPQPAFVPVSYTLDRAVNVQEYTRDNWFLPSVELTYAGEGWSLISSTSYFSRTTGEVEDGTEATQTVLRSLGAPASLGASGIAWFSPTTDERTTQELRFIVEKRSGFSGTIGARYNRELNVSGNGPLYIPRIAANGLFPSDLAWFNRVELDNHEKSIFGEGYYQWHSFELTLGVRQFWLDEHDNNYTDGLLAGGRTVAPDIRAAQSGLSPKYALAYKPSADLDLYASASKGFRAGGPDSPLSSFCNAGLAQLGLTQRQLLAYNPDWVWSYEVGGKALILDRRVSISGAAFQMNWTDIQQSLVVPVCFIETLTNAGAARNRGAEFELTGRPLDSLEIRLGTGYVDSRIARAGYSSQAVGSRVYQVPRWTVTSAATYTRGLTTTLTGFLSGDFSHVGDSLSGTTTTPTRAPLVRRAYDLVNLRMGGRWDTSELALYLKNVTNTKANLGDINPISYARIVDGVADPRIAILPPFEFGLQYRFGF